MPSVSRVLSAAILTVMVLLGSAVAYGQGGATGAISGSVVDASGGSVAGADVQIIDTRTEVVVRKLPTTSDGSFVVPLLPPGTYSVVVNKSGFTQAKADGIEVRVTETTRVTITLKPGAVSERVEISAQVTTVETTNATTGQSLGTETVRELPLATQNYQQLLTLSAGAQSELNAAAQLGRGSVKLFVNGQREDNNNFLIEGISATDYNVAQATYVPLPNPDVIQEFKVQTSLYDASQGRNGGGNVNAILKSGTKELHGDAYEFFRNDVLNANEYFLNRGGQSRPVVKQNIFGASLGGRVLKETYGFFFVNYQGSRQRSGLSPGTFISTNIPYIPAADRLDPATIASDCGVPSVDPVVAALLNFKSGQFGGGAGGYLFPAPTNVPAGAALCDPQNPVPFVVSRPGKYTDDQFTSNWDREFRSGADKISARFFFSDSESFLPFGGGDLQESLGSTLASSISSTALNFPFDTPVRARFLNITETHLFSPTLVNDFRFGFVHINDQLNNVDPITVTDLNIDRPTNKVTSSIYKFVLNSSGFELGPAPFANQSQNQNNYSLVDTVSWVKSKHLLRFGGEFTRVNLDKLFPQVFNGELFFFNTFAGGPIGSPTTDFQNFLLGAPQGSFGAGGVYNHQYRNNNFAAFAQDDWKIRQDLTLNLGLRAEMFGAFHDNLCHIGNLDPALAAAGKFVAYSPGPNPNPDVERELSRWLAVHPHADTAADAFDETVCRRPLDRDAAHRHAPGKVVEPLPNDAVAVGGETEAHPHRHIAPGVRCERRADEAAQPRHHPSDGGAAHHAHRADIADVAPRRRLHRKAGADRRCKATPSELAEEMPEARIGLPSLVGRPTSPQPSPPLRDGEGRARAGGVGE